MQHHERTGAFAKAEDALIAMLEAEPDNAALARRSREWLKELQRWQRRRGW